MRWLALAAILLGLGSPAGAREPLARPMERTPSIMTGGETIARSASPQRRKALRPGAVRARRIGGVRGRAGVPLRGSASAGSVARSINSSITQQQQDLQAQQRRQLEINSLRQDIQRSGPSLRCYGGALGC